MTECVISKGERAMTNYVGYVRVSTDKQGRSGLGLEAQEAAIAAFIAASPGSRLLAPVFTEVESGRNDSRPVLAQAIARCRQTGAVLLIAKLDRLARDVAFISNLMKSVPFKALDMPDADPTMIYFYAIMAQKEAENASIRTKAALAQAKLRGVKLGGDRGYKPPPDPVRMARAATAAAASHTRNANRFASDLAPVITDMRSRGITSHHGIAAALNAAGVTTPRGGQWTATAVRRTLERVAELA